MKRFLLLLLFGFLVSVTISAQKIKGSTNLKQQLIDEGWHRKEIDQLFQTYIQVNSGIKSKKDHLYTPIPKPGSEIIEDVSVFHLFLDKYKKQYYQFSKDFLDSENSSPIIKNDKVLPNEKIDRQKGLWKNISMYATSGRIYDVELHPENPKLMYANPDGDGIFKTIDGGISWKSITDNIPNRLHRNSYENIIVDPFNFNHVFSISRFGAMFETSNSGKSWNQVLNKNDKEGRAPQFKWVEALRNNTNELILIGTVTKKSGTNHGWDQGIYRSSNNGQSWDKLILEDGKFQEMAFHKKNKNIIYLGTTSKLYKSINSGSSFSLIYDFETGDRPLFISTVNDESLDALYAVVSIKNETQVHYSEDGGKTWELRQDSKNKIGFDKGIFGGNGSSGWTSFFQVDPFNKEHLIASSVASCESFDGGRNWELQSWSTRAHAQMPDGSRPLAPYGSHNADNHVLKFHPLKQGLMVKGCDAGLMMKEKGDTNWVNINGDMPSFLWYSVVVNEFGDRYLAGNTQDVNIQTYRYNKWENDRGYEGDAIFMNPSTNTTYFPVAKTEDGEGLNFLEPGFWKMHSWNYPKVASNYKNLDQIYIAFGRRPIEKDPQLPKYLYVTQNRGISFQRVPNMQDKEVFSVNVSRTSQPVLTAFTATDVMRSIDEGETWEIRKYPNKIQGTSRSRRVSGCVNPNNSKQLWVGGSKGQIFQSYDGGENWIDMKGSLPEGDIQELIFHEGTDGDLYVLVKGYGVFYRAKEDSDWRLWMNGFNLISFTEIRIDYPCQKLVASSYGRGLWEADLEKTVDRFYKNDIKIISKGKVNGKFVFQIDSAIQIPAYYNYNWTINGHKVGCNSKVLIVDKVKKGAIVKVNIVPIYASDVQLEANYKITAIEKKKVAKEKDMPLLLKDQFANAGYVDFFGANQNFTFSSWIKPIKAGVIAANRRTFYRDAKGWYLELTEDGRLNFNAAFYQNRSLEKTFEKGLDQSFSVESAAQKIKLNNWSHVAVSVNRLGAVTLYVNGELVASKKLDGIPSSVTLNHVMNLTLLADSYGMKNMNGSMRDIAIYTAELSEDVIKRVLKKGCKESKNLSFYIESIHENSEEMKELYTKQQINIKNIKN